MKHARKIRRQTAINGLDLVSEAINLLRIAPGRLLVAYYAGSVPFVLGFLYFWSDMSRSSFAHDRCLQFSMAVAGLFVWMKCWQSFFAIELRALLAHGTPGSWTPSRILRLVAVQTAVQPYGLLLIPVSLLLVLPFHATHAFFQNTSVVGDGTSSNVLATVKRSWSQARLWPAQNHFMLWLASPWLLLPAMGVFFTLGWFIMSLMSAIPGIERYWFLPVLLVCGISAMMFPFSPAGSVVVGNLGTLIIISPVLLNKLMGVQNLFTMAGPHKVFNVTFIATLFFLAYLCLDPVIKAVHALRCFYGDSRRSGEDILVELRSIAATGRQTQPADSRTTAEAIT
ncbi:MAG: hypothetical protein C0404_12485 [Verrucomicrobia bacterium]|nr:hypothetical protein [Verrucomicrobiota bacterium]